jgi:hypothetical protein
MITVFTHRATALGVALLIVGCASSPASNVRVDKDASADFSHCRSFGWLKPEHGTASSLNEQRIQTAAIGALKAKGYREEEGSPDCRITYEFATRELPKSGPSIGVGGGGGSGGIGGGIGLSFPLGHKQKVAGTLTLDVIDASRNAQIWTGSVDRTLSTPELTDADAGKAAKEILAKYPDRASFGK